MRNTLSQIKNHRPKKSLGQFFLRDSSLSQQIAVALPPNPLTIEIGPGDGSLTEALLKHGHKVIGVELDRDVVDRLESRVSQYDNFRLLSGNILKVDWKDLSSESEEICVAGNLPYHLTSPILFGIFDHCRTNDPPVIKTIVVMVQKEVGVRLTAQPGSRQYGGLTLLTKYHAKAEYLFTVPADRFFPAPKVDGAVIRLNVRLFEELPTVDYDQFRRIVRGSFAQRRKMMRNSLGVVNDLPDGWQNLPYDFTRRPERFDFEEFLSLTRDIISLASV